MAARRTGKKHPSSVNFSLRITPGERADMAWLARRLAVTDAEALRWALADALDRLAGTGVKVPRR